MFDKLFNRNAPTIQLFDDDEEDAFNIEGDPFVDQGEEEDLSNFFGQAEASASNFWEAISENEKLQESLFNVAVFVVNFVYDGFILMRMMNKLNRRYPAIPALSFAESMMVSRVMAAICRSAIDTMNRAPSSSLAEFKALFSGE